MADEETSPREPEEGPKGALADLPEVLTPEQVMKLLRIGRTQLYAALRSGELPAGKVGRRYFIHRDHLVKLLKL